MGAHPNHILQIYEFFLGKFLQCGYETSWKILSFFGFFNIISKKNSKLGNCAKVLITQNWPPKRKQKQTPTPNPIVVMNKPLVT
jgi:hypothetical protein